MKTIPKGCGSSIESTAELLVCAVRVFMGLESEAQLRALLHEDIHWAQLLQSAHQHGVIPQLYRSLGAGCRDAVPEAVLNQLKEQFDSNLRRNLRFTAELLQVLNLFAAHGIPVIPFKGPVLTTALYGNLALRQFIDLDILVPTHDVLKAKELLISQGYKPLYRLNRAQEAFHLRTNIEYIFYPAEPSFAGGPPSDPLRAWEPAFLAGTQMAL